jgi:peptidoglycan-N-acetylglucosamine deacetylase
MLLDNLGLEQSMAFTTYMNPVIPGDHPDCTVTRREPIPRRSIPTELSQSVSVLMRCISITILLATTPLPLQGQNNGPWQGRNCAVVLTYDDALNVHLDKVIPALDSLGLKGTFYLSGFFPSFRARVNDWAAVARNGHELGNHTLYHPCEGRAPGREWVPPDYDLNTYTLRRIVDEITMANALLEAIDQRTQRTFAYPCGDKKAGDSSYVNDVRRLFPGARGVQGKLQTMDAIDLYDVGSYMINGQSGEDLITRVEEARAKGALLVFLFHGVGGGHSLNVSLEAHQKLLRYLKDHEQEVWVAPLVDMCEFVRENRKAP